MRKLLIVLSVIVSIFIVFCVAVIILIQFPSLQNKINEIVNNEKAVYTVEPTAISLELPSISETVVEIEPIIQNYVTTKITHYNYKNSVDIEYPVIVGMADNALQDKVNKRIYDNCKSIVSLYPVSTSMQTLSVSANVKSLTDNYITIVYEGRVVGYTISNSSSSNNSSNNYSQSDNPSNNYQTQGSLIGHSTPFNNFSSGVQGFQMPNENSNSGLGSVVNPSTIGSNAISPSINGGSIINSNGIPNYQAPFSGNNSFSGASSDYSFGYPIAGVIGFSKTVSIDQRIFYTNTIDLATGEDVYLKQFVKPSVLAKYARSSKAEIINVSSYDIDEVRKYIRLSTELALTEVFDKADFRNTRLTSWPKSFSYVEDGDLYFSVKLSSKLGNYAIIKYPLS